MPGRTYPDVGPRGDLLDAVADLLELVRCLLDSGLDALSNAGRLMLSAELGDLGGEAGDVAGEGEEVIGKFGGEVAEIGVVGVRRVVVAAPGSGLRLERARSLERHGCDGGSDAQ